MSRAWAKEDVSVASCITDHIHCPLAPIHNPHQHQKTPTTTSTTLNNVTNNTYTQNNKNTQQRTLHTSTTIHPRPPRPPAQWTIDRSSLPVRGRKGIPTMVLLSGYQT
mmetsp:Transcript_2799/g.4238  ORF Transcript_2799/g.4238 Transcript_2799/m.4238 type:complete len:108 (+) Transcript_2799:183-506(+)